MEILVATILTFLSSCVTGQKWYFQNQISNWTCRPIRTQINSTIVAQTFNAEYLTRCVLHCAKTMTSGEGLVSLYFDAGPRQCHCNSMVDVDVDLDVDVDDSQSEIRYCTLKSSLKIDRTADQTPRITLWPHQPDCTGIYEISTAHLDKNDYNAKWALVRTLEGVHAIYPGDREDPVDVWCDMLNGGYTVIQRRLGGTENFNRNWTDYVNGFGDVTGEYWLGLKYLHMLTKEKTELTIELEPFNYETYVTRALNYYKFTVGNEQSKYVFQHRGVYHYMPLQYLMVEDVFHGQRQLRFSTADDDNDDDSERNLAADTHSGWWIGNISGGNPNSPYPDQRDNGSTTGTLFRLPNCETAWFIPDWNVTKPTMKILRTDYNRDLGYGDTGYAGPC